MLKVGIIGCGKIAQTRHLPEYAANPSCLIAALFDINTERPQLLRRNMALWLIQLIRI